MRSSPRGALHHPISGAVGPKSLSLYHARLSDGPLPFRTTGHCKHRFFNCVTFLRAPGVIRVPVEIRETDPLSRLFSNMAVHSWAPPS